MESLYRLDFILGLIAVFQNCLFTK